jgi:hypothetical protein
MKRVATVFKILPPKTSALPATCLLFAQLEYVPIVIYLSTCECQGIDSKVIFLSIQFHIPSQLGNPELYRAPRLEEKWGQTEPLLILSKGGQVNYGL